MSNFQITDQMIWFALANELIEYFRKTYWLIVVEVKFRFIRFFYFKDLVTYAKETGINLLTHGDPKGMSNGFLVGTSSRRCSKVMVGRS